MRELQAEYTLSEDERYQDPGFIKFLHDHVENIKNHESTNTLPLEPAFSYKWKADFFGLLNELNIKPPYYRAVMLVNDLVSPTDWDGDTDVITNISSKLIDDYLVTYTTRQE